MLSLLYSFKECWALFGMQLLTHEFDPFKVCSFFFFPKNLSLLIELNINLDLLTYRKIGSLGNHLYLDYSYMLMYRDLLGCRVFHRKNETGKDIL